MKNKFLFTLLLFIGTFCIFESIARFFLPKSTVQEYPLHKTMIWEQPKGTRFEHGVRVTINHYGLRGEAPEIPKPKEKKRIMSVGDSSIFGFLVEEEEVFTSVAVEKLVNWEDINAGCPGYSSEQSLIWVRQFAALFEIDILVIANLWSDSTNMGFSDREMLQGKKIPSNKNLLFLDRSSLFRVLYSIFSTFPRKLEWSERNIEGQSRVSPTEYRENLEQMTQIMARQGGKVIFLALASQEEIEEGRTDEKGEVYRKIMRQIATQVDSPIIEARDVWKNQTNLFADFIHPNKKGHRLLGEKLQSILIE